MWITSDISKRCPICSISFLRPVSLTLTSNLIGYIPFCHVTGVAKIYRYSFELCEPEKKIEKKCFFIILFLFGLIYIYINLFSITIENFITIVFPFLQGNKRKDNAMQIFFFFFTKQIKKMIKKSFSLSQIYFLLFSHYPNRPLQNKKKAKGR